MSEQLDHLYNRALELPQEARSAFAAEACRGDEKLRDDLVGLLDATEDAEKFFSKLGDAVRLPSVVAAALDDAQGSPSGSLHSSHPVMEAEVWEPGVLIGRYSIVGHLGRGGMGTVYRALDTRLDREVALKFPYPHIAGDADASERLLAEARAAAGLQHPNICVIHEVGETTEGRPFITMALCEGITLKQRLKTGRLPVQEAVSIATQITRALGAAHSRRIIHRDVKPGNVMLESDGATKLLDFGLAKSTEVSVTGRGPTPGTVAYMSPEQVKGDDIDNRSDLWSLGVVLYEMLSGHRPFLGGSDRVILQAILHEDPKPVQSVRTDVPANVADVVARLLRKERDARYSTAADVLKDLELVTRHLPKPLDPKTNRYFEKRRVAGIVGIAVVIIAILGTMFWSPEQDVSPRADAGSRAEPSIAVLPLANLGADSLDGALATGMTEELIATLARACGVRVIASTSTSAFRDRKMDVREIAESLGVTSVLEGSIQKLGSQLRVDVRLIAASDGSTQWSQSYDRDFRDMFAVQNEIVRTVAGELGLRFDKSRQLLRHKPRSIAAFELYLRGSDPVLIRSQTGTWKALGYYQQAIKEDSTYAAAHAGLALVQVRRGRTPADPGMPLRDLYELAESSARKAVSLDDSLPEAHYSLGRVLEAKLDFRGAELEIRRAIALDPARSPYHRSLSALHIWASRPQDALAEARLALETDPLNPYAHVALATALFASRRFDESLDHLKLIAAIKPPLLAVASISAQNLAEQNRFGEAIALLRSGAEAGEPMYQGLLGQLLARAGQRAEAERILRSLIARRDRIGNGAFYVAMVYLGLGDLEQTFGWLNKSVDDLSINNMIMDPTFAALRRDARFQQLQDRLGLEAR